MNHDTNENPSAQEHRSAICQLLGLHRSVGENELVDHLNERLKHARTAGQVNAAGQLSEAIELVEAARVADTHVRNGGSAREIAMGESESLICYGKAHRVLGDLVRARALPPAEAPGFREPNPAAKALRVELVGFDAMTGRVIERFRRGGIEFRRGEVVTVKVGDLPRPNAHEQILNEMVLRVVEVV